MRKFIYLFILLFASFNSYCQISDGIVKDTTCYVSNVKDTIYPKMIRNNDKTYVIFTLEQAKKIDNNSELLTLVQGVIDNANLSDAVWIKIVDGLKEEIVLLEEEISIKDIKLNKQDEKISNLLEQISKLENENKLLIEINNNTQSIIEEKDAIIRKNKIQKITGFSIGSVSIIAVVVLSILK
jgi:hypothetical protein